MRKLVRRRPSPAMIVAGVALIAATSGNAVADGVKAVSSVVGKDQVTTRSVKDNSLLLADFKKSDRRKLKGDQGPAGLPGAPGAAGAPGANGAPGADTLAKVFVKSTPHAIATAPQAPCPGTPPGTCFIPVTQFNTGTANCDAGQVAVGGGAEGDDVQLTDVVTTRPTTGATGWSATVSNDDVTRPHGFTVYVLCVPGTVG
jgi:hypothetical protein